MAPTFPQPELDPELKWAMLQQRSYYRLTDAFNDTWDYSENIALNTILKNKIYLHLITT